MQTLLNKQQQKKNRARLRFNHYSKLKHSLNVILIYLCPEADKLSTLTEWKVILETNLQQIALCFFFFLKMIYCFNKNLCHVDIKCNILYIWDITLIRYGAIKWLFELLSPSYQLESENIYSQKSGNNLYTIICNTSHQRCHNASLFVLSYYAVKALWCLFGL